MTWTTDPSPEDSTSPQSPSHAVGAPCTSATTGALLRLIFSCALDFRACHAVRSAYFRLLVCLLVPLAALEMAGLDGSQWLAALVIILVPGAVAVLDPRVRAELRRQTADAAPRDLYWGAPLAVVSLVSGALMLAYVGFGIIGFTGVANATLITFLLFWTVGVGMALVRRLFEDPSRRQPVLTSSIEPGSTQAPRVARRGPQS